MLTYCKTVKLIALTDFKLFKNNIVRPGSSNVATTAKFYKDVITKELGLWGLTKQHQEATRYQDIPGTKHKSEPRIAPEEIARPNKSDWTRGV